MREWKRMFISDQLRAPRVVITEGIGTKQTVKEASPTENKETSKKKYPLSEPVYKTSFPYIVS